MKIWRYEISFGPAKPKTVKTPVLQFPNKQQAQSFARYSTPSGQQIMSYDLIDNLHRKTIMNRVTNKIAGDCARMNYELVCTDEEGREIEAITEELRYIDVKITRKILRGIFRDSIKYGTAFLYVQYGPDGLPLVVFNVHPKLIKPDVDDFGNLLGWVYSGASDEVKLKPEEILYFPEDPETGEIYGKSIFEPVIQMLELLINSQMNIAVLLDRFALPIVLWMLDSQQEAVKTPPEEILEFMQFMVSQLEAGNDAGMDSSVDAKVLGTSDTLIDFVPTVEHLLYSFGAQVGVPMQLLGLRGDNLSVSRMQNYVYNDLVRDKQENVGDMLVEQLYKPYLEAKGILQIEDYDDLYINFPIRAVEENSEAIKWIAPAQQNGYISRKQATNSLGFKGKPVPLDEIEVPLEQPEVVRPGARKPSDPEQTPEVPEPSEEDRDHDTGQE
jgi:hypothetical protein